MRLYSSPADLPGDIPVFPLPGVILLPRAQLPLNVFEPRYLTMVDAAMSGARIIGMIQPRAGEEEREHPALAGVGCAGRITSYSETLDGRYLITLTGIARFRIAHERDVTTPFRQVTADYAAFAQDFGLETVDDIERGPLLAALRPYLDVRKMETDWSELKEAPIEALVSALAMICAFSPSEKQALLEAPDVRERARALIALLEFANASRSNGNQPVH